MMKNLATQEQGAALATLVHALRPEWSVEGVYAVLARARDRGDAFALAHAALYAAADPENRTPGVIALPGPHWTRGVGVEAVSPANVERCPKDGHQGHPAHSCGYC